MKFRPIAFALSVIAFSLALPAAPLIAGAADDPFADDVVDYDPGTNPEPAYLDPHTTLGGPERYTGEGIFPGVVSAFNAAFGVDEIVSIGAGGHLVLRFDTPVVDDPNNPYGIDLLIFGNTGFILGGEGVMDGLYGNDGGVIEVSDDGVRWEPVKGVAADGPMPTMGYADSGPFDERPGSILTDFTRPVDPSLDASNFQGLDNEHVIALYRGSGGGTGIDLAPTGLSQIRYVRISNPAGSVDSVEIDAMSDVSPRIPGDVDFDGVVGIDDLFGVINAWGAAVPGGPAADFDLDGDVDVDDLFAVINHWTS